jgi:Amt family ammonium transporter
MVLGAVAALPSYALVVYRPRTRLDETLDVLAAHGLGGVTGILFIGFFAQKSWNGVSDGFAYGNASQLGWQAIAVLVTTVYAFAGTAVLLKLVGLVMPLRVPAGTESLGLDTQEHGEEAYSSAEGAVLVSTAGGFPADVPVADGRGGLVPAKT